MIPLTFNEPVIEASEFTLNPFGDTDAVTEPVAIWAKFNPVIPLAGILYMPFPSPLNEPLNAEAVTDPDMA